jgi:hypothetical protein
VNKRRFLCAAVAVLALTVLPLAGAGRAAPNTRVYLPIGLRSVAFDGSGAGVAATNTAVPLGPSVPTAVPTGTPVPTAVPGQAPAVLRPQPGPGNTVVPLFQQPFAGEADVSNFFDHDLAFEFTDTNGYQLTWWGQRVSPGVDGHDGIDFRLDVGTPLLAAADGTVTFDGEEAPFYCTSLGQTVAGLWVDLQHTVQVNGSRTTIVSEYGHLSRIDAQVGQRVARGQQIGLSGNTGCSTAPHVHFATLRERADGENVKIDPYGWDGPGQDPWAANSSGAASLWLWLSGQAPVVHYRDVVLAANAGSGNARVAITMVRWFGWHDDLYPNNEYVELTLDPRFAPSGSQAMTGYTLSNNHGDTYSFPSGFTVRQGQPARLYSGKGVDSATILYWGRSAAAWDPMGDCAILTSTGGGRYRMSVGDGICP